MGKNEIMIELDKHIRSARFVDSDYVDCVRADMLNDIVELLKEQEPMPMTLEEVKKAEGTVVWIETPGCEDTVERFALVECVNEQYGFVELNLPFGDKPAYEKGKCAAYGKAWRCWKERPDEGQRMRWKWDE